MANISISQAVANTDDISTTALPVKFYLGTVLTGSNQRWRVQFDGTPSSMTKYIKSAYNVTMAFNARVLIMELSGTYLIIARIPG